MRIIEGTRPAFRGIIWAFGILGVAAFAVSFYNEDGLPMCLRRAYRDVRAACEALERAPEAIRRIQRSQDAHFSQTNTYSGDPSELGFTSAPGMQLTIEADSLGWRAAYGDTAVSVGCALFVGVARDRIPTLGGLLPQAPGQMVCDDLLAPGN